MMPGAPDTFGLFSATLPPPAVRCGGHGERDSGEIVQLASFFGQARGFLATIYGTEVMDCAQAGLSIVFVDSPGGLGFNTPW
jgi:hypothetical protein